MKPFSHLKNLNEAAEQSLTLEEKAISSLHTKNMLSLQLSN